MFHFSGGSDDWAKGVAKIKYSYTVELPDTGLYGFLLPKSEILPVGRSLHSAIYRLAAKLRTMQVWSQTQFYSVDFSQSRISVEKCIFNMLASAVLDGVFGPLCLARHT